MRTHWKLPGLAAAIVLAGFLCGPAMAQDADEVAAWDAVKTSDSAEQLRLFLESFPIGYFAREARERYSRLAGTMLPAEVQNMEVTFPVDARRLGLAVGPRRSVRLDILVRKDGTAATLKLLRSSGFDPYDGAAKRAAAKATYLPAVDHGNVLDSHLTYTVTFGLLCNRAAGDPPDCYNGRFPQK